MRSSLKNFISVCYKTTQFFTLSQSEKGNRHCYKNAMMLKYQYIESACHYRIYKTYLSVSNWNKKRRNIFSTVWKVIKKIWELPSAPALPCFNFTLANLLVGLTTLQLRSSWVFLLSAGILRVVGIAIFPAQSRNLSRVECIALIPTHPLRGCSVVKPITNLQFSKVRQNRKFLLFTSYLV